MNHPESQSRVGVGVSSVLMVLVVLATAALSLLALSSAKSTETMTLRNVESAVSYYSVAAEVQKRLAQMDEALLEAPEDADFSWFAALQLPDVVFLNEKDGVAFRIDVESGDGRSILAQGKAFPGQYPRYVLNSHRMYSKDEITAEESPYLNLMGE